MHYHSGAHSQPGNACLSDGRVHQTTVTELLPQTFGHLIPVEGEVKGDLEHHQNRLTL